MLWIIAMGIFFPAFIITTLIFTKAFLWKTETSSQTDDRQLVLRVMGAISAALVAIMVATTFFSSFHTVPAGHVGVVYEFGAIVNQTTDGPVWTTPWQNLKRADNRVQKITFEEIAAASKETQDVTYVVTLNYRVSPDAVQSLYRNVGANYFEILVPSRLQQILKDESVQYPAIEITQKRDEIREAVTSRLASELAPYSVTIVSLQIDNINYSPEFNSAIERKQVATQAALEAEETVRKTEAEARQAIERARGEGESVLIRAQSEAEANRILSESITPELLQRQAIDKLNPNVSVIMLPSSEGIIIDPGSLIK